MISGIGGLTISYLSMKDGYEPSCVGPMPPEVITKSYLPTIRRLASILYDRHELAQANLMMVVTLDLHFFFLLCNYFYLLAIVHRGSMYTIRSYNADNADVQVNSMFKAIPREVVGIAVKSLSI